MGVRILALLTALGSLALAGSLLGELEVRGGKTVEVGKDQVVTDDLYATGETIRIDGTVRGDLVAAGREIVISGVVEGDVLAAAQSVTITGTVGDDVRIAGQVLHVGPNARLGDDLMGAGFSLETEPGSGVGGTVRFFGYQALLAGEVGEGVSGSMAALRLAGTVHDGVDVEVGARGASPPPMAWPTPIPVPSVAPGLAVTDSARIAGKLRYQSPTEGAIAPAAAIEGGVDFQQKPTSGSAEPSLLERLAKRVRRLIALLLVGALMLWLAPRWSAELAATIRSRPLPSLGWGVVSFAAAALAAVALGLVVALVAALLGLATLSGLMAAVIGGGVLAEIALALLVLVAFVYLAPVAVALAGGGAAVGLGGSGGAPAGGRRFVALVLGLVVLGLLVAIPYLGLVVAIAAAVLGMGSLWLWLVDRFRRAPATSP